MWDDLITRLKERHTRFHDPMDEELLQALHLGAQHRAAHHEWLDKTEWVQTTSQVGELGKHRADVIKARMDTLQSRVDIRTMALLHVRARMEQVAEKRGGHGKFASIYPIVVNALMGVTQE